MNILHYCSGNASFAPHVLLEEIGAPYALQPVDREQQAHRSPAYLKLNPNGSIPVLVDGDLVLYETAAICLHLADTHPAAHLAPALGTVERAHFYKWLMWLTNTVQASLIHYFYSERMVNAGDSAAAAQVKTAAQAKVGACLQQIETELARHRGPWMLGANYSALDPYTWMVCRWTRGFSDKPARLYPHIAAFLARLLERPAMQRAIAQEKLSLPLY